jgi:predicted TIM-barrel enzyme
MPRFERKAIVERFQDMIRRGEPIIGGGAGTGISAKCEEAGGIDLIIVYNSGRYRMAGRASSAGLLAYGNANDIVKEMALEVLPVCKTTPVIAGVNGTDPFVIMPVFLKELKELGFSGVQNFPTVGIIDGTFRVSLEETGINFSSEIDMIRQAHELDMLTTPYVFSADEAVEMARAGADLIVPHMGVTTGGSIGATTSKTLNDSVRLIDEWAEAARRIRKDVIIIAHGGPISSPEDVDYVLRNSNHCNGFYGASSVERLPVETAITNHIKTFKGIGALKDKGGR